MSLYELLTAVGYGERDSEPLRLDHVHLDSREALVSTEPERDDAESGEEVLGLERAVEGRRHVRSVLRHLGEDHETSQGRGQGRRQAYLPGTHATRKTGEAEFTQEFILFSLARFIEPADLVLFLLHIFLLQPLTEDNFYGS